MSKITKNDIISKWVTFHEQPYTGTWEITHLLPCKCKVNIRQNGVNTAIKVETLLYLVNKGVASLGDNPQAKNLPLDK